ncbi:MAG: helix-turn-helix transcriptional regulator [bacterium]|nr:helix-turn-helix transcriptional regulator [bacterium]
MSDIARLTALEMLVLSVLVDGEKYGLQIASAVEEDSEGRKKISVGSLYPVLHRLEKKGFVKSRWGEATEERAGARRRYYIITALGETSLSEAQKVFSRLWNLDLGTAYHIILSRLWNFETRTV